MKEKRVSELIKKHLAKALRLLPVVAVAMTIAVPATVMAEVPTTLINSWEELQSNIKTGDHILKLNADISANKAGGTNLGTLKVYGESYSGVDARITIDLNGHIIDRGLADETDPQKLKNGAVITVGKYASLVIKDSNPEAVHTGKWAGIKGGIITGGNNTDTGVIINGIRDGYPGGGISATGGQYAALTINGGTITGNHGVKGGGIFDDESSCFNCKLSIQGGTISGNTADIAGGGVYFREYNTNNVILTLSGDPVIRGNTVGGKANNLYIAKTIGNQNELSRLFVKNKMTGNVPAVGVTTELIGEQQVTYSYYTGQTSDSIYNWSTVMNGADPVKYFFSDDPQYFIGLKKRSAGDEVYDVWKLAREYDVIISEPEHGSVSCNLSGKVLTGTKVTLTATPVAGYRLKELTVSSNAFGEAQLTRIGSRDYIFTMPDDEVTVTATFEEGVPESSWFDVKEAFRDGGSVSLKNDVICPDYEGPLEVLKDVTLDLNGHILSRGLTEPSKDGEVIRITGGKLTVRDRKPDTAHTGMEVKGGVITGGNNLGTGGTDFSAISGGGILVCGEHASLVLDGGTIYGNNTEADKTVAFGKGNGGGINIARGTVSMNGGAIIGNTSHDGVDKDFGSICGSGGGVCVDGGSFTMTGGIISRNTAKPYRSGNHTGGGGVCVINNGIFTLEDGEITSNIAVPSSTFDVCGGGVFNLGNFIMSGGSIAENHIEKGLAAGVYNGGIFRLSGGSITGNINQAKGDLNKKEIRSGGIYLGSNSDFWISGSPVISGNMDGDGSKSDIYVEQKSTKIKVDGKLEPKEPIGIYYESALQNDESIVFTEGLSGNGIPEECFVSQDERVWGDFSWSSRPVVVDDGNGEAALESLAIYTVHGVLNGGMYNGSNETISQNLTKRSKAYTLPIPERTGYDFAGWYSGNGIKKEAEIPKDEPKQVVTVSANDFTGYKADYWAVWNPHHYTVSFNLCGGEASADYLKSGDANYLKGIRLAYDDIYPVSSVGAGDIVRTGYTFGYWNTKEDGSGIAEGKFNSFKSLADEDGANVNLYAQWSPIQYRLTLLSNEGGSSSHSYDQWVKYDEKIQLKKPDNFIRSGYTLSGWNTEVDGSGTSYETEAEIMNLASTNEAVIRLYAQWSPITFKVHFEPNGATLGTMKDQTFTYGVSQNLTKNAFKCEYSVTFDYNGADRGNLPEIAGTSKSFAGWSTVSSVSTGYLYADEREFSAVCYTQDAVVNLYAVWRGTATVGGENSGIIALPTPQRDGYTFEGWCESEKLDGEAHKGSYAAYKDITLHAKWSINHYKVGFFDNGGIFEEQDYEYGAVPEFERELPAHTGAVYIFKGWKERSKESATVYTSVTGLPPVTANVTYEAVYDVAYDVTVTDCTADRTSTFAGDTVTVVALNGPEGFVFDYWTGSEGVVFADVNAATTTFTMPAANVSVMAHFRRAGDKNDSSSTAGGQSGEGGEEDKNSSSSTAGSGESGEEDKDSSSSTAGSGESGEGGEEDKNNSSSTAGSGESGEGGEEDKNNSSSTAGSGESGEGGDKSDSSSTSGGESGEGGDKSDSSSTSGGGSGEGGDKSDSSSTSGGGSGEGGDKSDSSSTAGGSGNENKSDGSSSAADGKKDAASGSTPTTSEKSDSVSISVGGQELSASVGVEHFSEVTYTGEKLTAEELGVKADTGELVKLAKTALVSAGGSANVSDSDLAALFITSYKIGGKGEAGELAVITRIKFDKKLARSLGMRKEDIKAMTKAVAALNKAMKKTPAKVRVAKADLSKCFESLEASINAKGKLKVKSLTINVGGKQHKLKKKDITIAEINSEKGTVTLEGNGKNVEGKVTVDVNTGKKVQ